MERFGKKPYLGAILFLVGVQEFGDIREKFTKEQKQDLMHIAVCQLLSESGYYELEKVDQDGWPHFKQLKALPTLNMIEQENFIHEQVLLYFENVFDEVLPIYLEAINKGFESLLFGVPAKPVFRKVL